MSIKINLIFNHYYYYYYYRDLLPGNGNAIGLAYVGTACQPGANTMIFVDKGGYGSVPTVAHELGHS